VVDAKTRTVSVYRSRTDIEVLTNQGTLTGGDVLPGFSLPVSAIFAP
jgi:Uma2 family endonuclease